MRPRKPPPQIFNAYFDREGPTEPPQSLYVWLSKTDDGEVFTLEAIDADWIDEKRRALSVKQIASAPVSILRVSDSDSRAVIKEFVHTRLGAQDERAIEQAEGPGWWFKLDLAAGGPIRASFAGNINQLVGTRVQLGPPQWVGKRVLGRLGKLNILTTLPNASHRRLTQILTTRHDVLGVAVYDVGQGSSAALVDTSCRPIVYFDVGGGSGANLPTYPNPMLFCTALKPRVVLSHWHQDHWYSICRDTRLLALPWVVPRQPLGPVQAAAAAHIVWYGKLYVWDAIPSLRVGPVELFKATGVKMNDSGIATVVHLPIGAVLLPGDADYAFVPVIAPLTALVVTHHGGRLGSSTVIPPPARATSPAVFSFGDPNTYGHPLTTALHTSAGWGNQVATATMHAGRRGHCIIGPPGVRNVTGCVPGTCHLGDLRRV